LQNNKVSPAEIQRIFNQKLSRKLTNIDLHRKKSIEYLYFFIASFLLGILLLINYKGGYLPQSLAFLKGTLIFAGLICVIFSAIYGFKSFKQFNIFRGLFKETILKIMFEEFFPAFNFDPQKGISQNSYNQSRLFLKRVDRFKSEDHFVGKHGETQIEFSEIHAEYKTEHRNRKGQKRTHWHTIFKGIFLRADFNKKIQSATFVFPDFASNVVGEILGEKLNSIFGDGNHGEIIKLENPIFEKNFRVYSHDAQEARYILTPKFMEDLVTLKNKFNVTPSISFIEGVINIALFDLRDHFEPKLWTPIKPSELFEFIKLTSKIIEIVDDLDLNTRIWTKL
jgi:hypothetical protein